MATELNKSALYEKLEEIYNNLQKKHPNLLKNDNKHEVIEHIEKSLKLSLPDGKLPPNKEKELADIILLTANVLKMPNAKENPNLLKTIINTAIDLILNPKGLNDNNDNRKKKVKDCVDKIAELILKKPRPSIAKGLSEEDKDELLYLHGNIQGLHFEASSVGGGIVGSALEALDQEISPYANEAAKKAVESHAAADNISVHSENKKWPPKLTPDGH